MAVSSRGLYLRVGALILVGAGLALAFVLFFTSSRLGRDARQFETYLRESVTGLAVGAAVRFRGVQLGQVTEITLVAAEYPPPTTTTEDTAYRRVLVRFAMDLRRFPELPNTESAVRAGLRARLATQGITGVSYIELDFVDPMRFPAEPWPWQATTEVIPSAQSTVSQVTSVAEQLAQRLAEAPIEAILRDAAGLLADLRAQLADTGDVARASREAAETMAELRRAIAGLNLPALGAELRGTVADARGVLGGPELRSTLRSADAAAQQLRTALAAAPAAVAQVQAAARAVNLAVGDINGDLTPTLRDLRAVSGNLRDTTELLRRAPGAALLAPPPPAPIWATERRR